ncbi:DUF4349 domain-containing protein [Pontixanthobacter luteolus]|uniref:DUF4349 domain-containing protein n=1 Tax=Pontixanthobacter luteolus TaxID=295089 RepID=UPI002303B2E8|nr:DUF4349 domain-containing protein [Pontixanthobacter luteolus]
MNYKVLAASGVAAIGLLAIVVTMTENSQNGDGEIIERLTIMDPPSPSTSYDYGEPAQSISAPAAMMIPPSEAAMPEIPALENEGTAIAGQPRIAYRFGYGFRLPGDAVKPLQDRHADMCETRGPNVCRIISMQQSGEDDAPHQGSLHLAVAAPIARCFGKAITGVAQNAEGELVSSSIDGEDLSKQIVDTEARLRTRIVLRDRLMEVLRSRRGTVAELVEAERGVAKVNEEIDQARSWLAEMTGRVDFSQMHITYSSGAVIARESSFTDPVTDALSAAGPTFGGMIGALIRLLTFLLPLLLLGWLAVKGWRAAGRPGSGLLKGPEYNEMPVG